MAHWSCLKSCGLCCACLSVWAIIQLGLMGLFFYIETPVLIEDVEEHDITDFKDFIKKTRANYAQNALNCWVVAGAYAATFILSLTCIFVSNSKIKAAERKLRDEDLICGVSTYPMISNAKTDKKKGSPKEKASRKQKELYKEKAPPKKKKVDAD